MAYHLPLFTDYLNDLETRQKLGWQVTALLYLNIAVNVLLTIYQAVRMVKLKIKRKLLIRKAKKYVLKKTEKAHTEKDNSAEVADK